MSSDFFLTFDNVDTFKYIHFLHVNLDKICISATEIYIGVYDEHNTSVDQQRDFIMRLQKYLKQLLVDDGLQPILIIEHVDDIFITNGKRGLLSSNPENTIGILRSQLNYGHSILEKIYKYFSIKNFDENLVKSFVRHTQYYADGCLPARLTIMQIWYNTVSLKAFSDKWYNSLELYNYPDLSPEEQIQYLNALSSAYTVIADLKKWTVTPESFSEWIVPAVAKFNMDKEVVKDYLKSYS